MNFIYENNHSICPELCKEIIEMYENEKDKYPGNTLGGVNKKIKDTTDFLIPKNNERWSKIEDFLYKELQKNILKYTEKINCPSYKPENNNGRDSSLFKNANLEAHDFMIQKYNKNEGKYIYHHDFAIIDGKHIVITFLWYLNTVEDGGETEFWDSYKIKPVEGKIILFPASWAFQHRGKMPVSDNKYIITNWLYVSI